MENKILKVNGEFDTLVSEDKKINGMLMSNRTVCEVRVGANKYQKSNEERSLLVRMKKTANKKFNKVLTNKIN
jgi:hypothetical protein